MKKKKKKKKIQIFPTEEANATARQKWEESSRHAEENFASASKTVEALADSFQHAQKLAADLEARKAELQASAEQVELLLQQERNAPEDPSAVPADVTKLLETVCGIRLSTSDSHAGQLRVSFVQPAEAVGSSILFGFEYLGGRAILRSASLDGPSIPDARDLVAFSVALDDPAFLVEEVRLRLRCASLRTAEVDALKAARHIVFEQNGLLRFTFPSGVMATIETAPDYPLGVGSVRLASLDTMGLFSDNLQSARAMLSKCTTIKEHVETLASKFGKK